MSARIAIIGAGLAGLTAARALQEFAEIVLFDKARGVGGRLATRYADPYQFDHGAQHFTAKSEAFQRALAPLMASGIVARWDAHFVEMERSNITATRRWGDDFPHYVGTTRMNSIGKALAEGLDVRLEQRITSLQQRGALWHLQDEKGTDAGSFDWVICTAPPQQAVDILPQDFAHFSRLSSINMLGCYAVMLGFEVPLPLPFDAALVKQADISWISVNSSKPGREQTGYSLLVHATNAYAQAHMDAPLEEVEAHLHREISEVIGHDVRLAAHRAIHRWRYANIAKQTGDPALVDVHRQLIACGDWCIHGRVEAAFLSGMAAAEAIREALAG